MVPKHQGPGPVGAQQARGLFLGRGPVHHTYHQGPNTSLTDPDQSTKTNEPPYEQHNIQQIGCWVHAYEHNNLVNYQQYLECISNC